MSGINVAKQTPSQLVPVRRHLLYNYRVDERLDLDLLGDDPFEVDTQVTHLFKHPHLGMEDVLDVWTSEPLFYEADPPGHWLMVAEIGGTVLVVPITPANSGDPARCRPIGCYKASVSQAATYRRDRDAN